jgi:hypothetical protein
MSTTIHPAGWGRACSRCGLVGLVLVSQGAHEPPGFELNQAPPPPDLKWKCGCGRWVHLRGGR